VEEEETAEGAGTASPPWGVRLPSIPAGDSVNVRSSAKQQRMQFRAASLSKCKIDFLDLKCTFLFAFIVLNLLTVPEEKVAAPVNELGVMGTSVQRKAHSSPNTSLEGAPPPPTSHQPLSAAALAWGSQSTSNSVVNSSNVQSSPVDKVKSIYVEILHIYIMFNKSLYTRTN
jgi:hypothetical protein